MTNLDMDDTPAGLRWTGHPLVDAGVAALTAFSRRRDPAQVTFADLEEFAQYAQEHYLPPSFLSKSGSVLFTTNGYLNPSFKPDTKLARLREAMTAFRQEGNPAQLCTYCARPGLRTLHRDDVPLLLGRTGVNFYPGGQPGLVLCGLCQTAIYALAIGAPLCSGRALVVQASNPRLILRLVRQWVDMTRTYLQLGDAAQANIRAPRTRLVEALERVQEEGSDEDGYSDVVAYHLSNSGQGPGIQVYELPSNVVGFLSKARTQRTRAAWMEIERRSWQRVGRRGSESAADLPDEERAAYRNYLYEDLFSLPETAQRFIRIYFLRRAAGLVRGSRAGGADDPRREYNPAAEGHLVSWDLAELFLREVLSMDQKRIEAIRTLADRLAEEINADNNRRLFQNAYRARDYRTVRRLLINTCFRQLQRNAEPIVTFDSYLDIFEEGEELARTDWRLAWDLVLIRMIEQLHQKGWLVRNRDVVEEAAQETATDTEESELVQQEV